MSNKCINKYLEIFSNEHYTYINQIFGDTSVREIIAESYADRDWEFSVEDAGADFEYSNHHVLVKYDPNCKLQQKWCSVDEGYQNVNVNKNDTLCQSYTLLRYLNKSIHTNMKKRQMEMINMYRNIMKREHFQTEMKSLLIIMKTKYNKNLRKTIKKRKTKTNNSLWQDYTKHRKTHMNPEYEKVMEKIHDVLNKWEKFGYLFFIKDGKCP